MSEQIFNTRIVHKHDIEENWNKAVNFIPKQGELIVYDIDENYNYERFKIGDGFSNVIDLPFAVTKLELDATLTMEGMAADAKAVGDALNSKVPTTRTINNKKLSSNITLNASDVNADPKGTASTSVSNHNTSDSAHEDIRILINNLTTRLNTVADSSDTELDQLSEIVAIIKSNKSLIEFITTNKVNVSDIINNLTTNVSNKPLSAAQGVVIKELIDDLQTGLDNHTHNISDVSGLQTALDGKAASSHGTHVTYSTTNPVMDGTASVGTASTVARSDHKHPTDTSRASKSEFNTHTGNTTVHITSTERTNWNAAKSHADSAHAPSNAEKNQNAFSNIKVGSTTIAADTTTDTLTLAGSNVTITPDATNDKVTIGITKNNVTAALGYTPPTTNTTYDVATTSANGLMSAAMVTKLNGISTGANKTVVDSALSASSTNPVQNKVINTAITNINAKMLTVDVNNTNEGEPNLINADTLGGYAADEYVRKDQASVEVNYSVVNNLTKPTNEAEFTQNMIWIDTDTLIGRVFFGNNEPHEILIDGDIWIHTGTTSSVSFNSLKIGNAYVNTIYPILAKQYVSGAWVDVTAKSYQNGEWVDWIRYLYNEGDQCVSLTGGWSANGVSDTSSDAIVPPIINDDHIFIGQTTVASKASEGVAWTENKIFIGADNNALYADITAITFPSGEDVTNFGVSTSKVINEGVATTMQVYLNKDERKTVRLDISNVPAGEYYVFFRSYYVNGTGKSRAFKLHKVWLE